MNSARYIGIDVHKEATTIAVMNAAGKLVMESIVETKAATIVQFLEGLRGELYLTFEEGTWAAWLYDLLKPYVTKVVVCNPRKNALLKAGNKSDRIDARKLAELLRAGLLSPVYHGETGLRTLKELSRSYPPAPDMRLPATQQMTEGELFYLIQNGIRLPIRRRSLGIGNGYEQRPKQCRPALEAGREPRCLLLRYTIRNQISLCTLSGVPQTRWGCLPEPVSRRSTFFPP